MKKIFYAVVIAACPAGVFAAGGAFGELAGAAPSSFGFSGLRKACLEQRHRK